MVNESHIPEEIERSRSFVLDNVENVNIQTSQHAKRDVLEVMVDYPITIGEPLIRRALADDSKSVTVYINSTRSHQPKPSLRGNTIFLND